MPASANLNLMKKSARKVGRQLVKDFREVENLQVSTKGPGDFVTRADREAERVLREDLLGARPSYGFLGEETGETEGEDPTRRWIVDPLDGTTNFLHGLPHWAVSIALEHKGEIVAGVIFDPAKDEMFWAEKGAGAWMNESRMRVSGRSRMNEAVFATGMNTGGRDGVAAVFQDLARIGPATAGVRRWGASALDLAYVAAGRFDGYWDRAVQPWDIAAGLILVREAGGFAGGIAAGANPLGKGGIVAANASLHEGLGRLVRGD